MNNGGDGSAGGRSADQIPGAAERVYLSSGKRTAASFFSMALMGACYGLLRPEFPSLHTATRENKYLQRKMVNGTENVLREISCVAAGLS